MEVSMLTEKIEKYYSAKSYKKALTYLFRYFHKDEVGIYDRMLDIYIDCQIHLGYFENAINNINVMEKLFPYYYDMFDLAMRYASTCQEEELNKLLSKYEFSTEENYLIAKRCFYNGLHAQSADLFKKCLLSNSEEANIKKIQEYLKKMEIYKHTRDAFVSQGYPYFKHQGNTLEPGHIIYVDKIRNQHKINRFNKDPKRDKRPYMVWEIIEGLIYAFPVTSVTRSNDKYILYHNNYSGFDFDRKIKDNLVCIEEKDVGSVIDKVREKDFNILMKNIYASYYTHPENNNIATELFMNAMLEQYDTGINDVIGFYDTKQRARRRFFILDIDEENKKFKTVEVDRNLKDKNAFGIIGKSVVTIDTDCMPLEVIKLSEKQKEDLLSAIPFVCGKINTSENDFNLEVRKIKKKEV